MHVEGLAVVRRLGAHVGIFLECAPPVEYGAETMPLMVEVDGFRGSGASVLSRHSLWEVLLQTRQNKR